MATRRTRSVPGTIPDWTFREFLGLITEVKDLRALPSGATPDSLNWLTSSEKDSIELRRGTALLGQTRVTGAGAITGLGIGRRADGVQVPFFTFGRIAKYYDSVADDVVEIGSNLFPAAADGDEFSVESYQNLIGSNTYFSSPNSSVYKVPAANPGSAVDQNATTYRGFLKFGQSRSFLFDRRGDVQGNRDENGLYCSWLDKDSLSDYTFVDDEVVGSGDAVEVTFTSTLVQRTGVRTVGRVLVTDGTETFQDDGNGVLAGSLGGTGTINYATGALSVTFNTAPANAANNVLVDYYWEDSTSEGPLDFSIALVGGVRTAGTGRFFPQFDGGGALKALFPLATVFYAFHELKTWQTSIPTDDDNASTVNLPFRDKLGVQSQYGVFGGALGIYYVNTTDPNKPVFEVLSVIEGGKQANIAAPKELSRLLDLSPYVFTKAVAFEWGDFVLFCCQQVRNGTTDTFNSLMFLYNKKSGIFDLMEYPSSRLAEYVGTLIAGDPLTNNVFTLFSGFDEDGAIIANHWKSGFGNLGVSGQKRFTRMVFEGLIQVGQQVEVSLAFDGGDFIDTFTIDGSGTYVNRARSIAVGNFTMGSKVVGGGAVVFANHFEVEIKVQSPLFEYVRWQVKAISGGFVRLLPPVFKDIRYKGRKVMPERIG